VKSERSAGTFFPVVNVKEEPEKYVVEVEVPGVDPDEMEIELKGSMLIIKGEKKFEKESDEDEIHLIERRYGAFRRTLTLPDNILADEITAKNKNGVLYISIPKGKEKDSKKIRIENGNIA
jgi:HSP20 family protein